VVDRAYKNEGSAMRPFLPFSHFADLPESGSWPSKIAMDNARPDRHVDSTEILRYIFAK
jgi:hypothetical protein